MTALTTRDALERIIDAHSFNKALALCSCGAELGGRGNRMQEHRAHLVDALLASGDVIDAATLADDEALAERFVDALDKWPTDPMLRDTTRRVARTYLRAIAAALTKRGAQ